MSAIDSSQFLAFQDHVKKAGSEIFEDMFYGFDSARHIRMVEGIKSKYVMNDISFGDLSRRYASHDFDPPADQIAMAPRVLEVTKQKVELQIVPAEFEADYRQHLRQPGQNPYDLPFEAYIMQSVAQKINQEIEDAVWQGEAAAVPAATDLMKATFDGFIKIAKDNGTPVATGASTAANILANINAVYRTLGTPEKRNPGKIFISYTDAELVAEARQNNIVKYTSDRSEDPTMEMPYWLNPRWTVVPTAGMGASRTIIATPGNNLGVGTDLIADAATFNVSLFDRYIKVFIDFYMGAQIGRTNATRMAINDQ